MPLSLEQYAGYLDTRKDLSWPPPPEVEQPRVRPAVVHVLGVRAVLWNVYGTLINIWGGDLLFEHPQAFVMNLALERTIQEFKMWGSMSRKPGQPSEYMKQIYDQVLLEQRTLAGSAERYPEVRAESIWEAILKRLLQKNYQFDAGFFGSLNEYSKKVAYFFHCCLQGYAAYAGAAETLRGLGDRGIRLGLAGEGQCFTVLQLHRALTAQDADAKPESLFAEGLVLLSHEARARSPSERLFRPVLDALADGGIGHGEILYITSRIPGVAVAKRLGMRTALFAGDKASLQATPEQLKEPANRPDVLLSELPQVLEVV